MLTRLVVVLVRDDGHLTEATGLLSRELDVRGQVFVAASRASGVLRCTFGDPPHADGALVLSSGVLLRGASVLPLGSDEPMRWKDVPVDGTGPLSIANSGRSASSDGPAGRPVMTESSSDLPARPLRHDVSLLARPGRLPARIETAKSAASSALVRRP